MGILLGSILFIVINAFLGKIKFKNDLGDQHIRPDAKEGREREDDDDNNHDLDGDGGFD